jgi:hypothetical protein
VSETRFSSPETAQRVYEYLIEHPKISNRAGAEAVGVGRNTFNRAIARLLVEDRLIVIRLGTGDGYPTTYEVLNDRRS